MKTIYYSNKVRMRVLNKKDVAGKYFGLRIQERGWFFWTTIERLDIEIKNYWGHIPGDRCFGGCLRIGYAYGGYREVWPPDIFDLKKRVTEFMKEYFEKKREQLQTQKVIQKQINSL